MNDGKSDKRVCLLTGASGKLGSAFCSRFASHYAIAAIYNTHVPPVPSNLFRNIDPLRPNAPLEENEHPVFAIKANLSDPLEHLRVIDLALARFSQIDLVVHAAGVSIWGDLIGSNRVLESFQQQLNLNAFVPLSLSTLLLRRDWMHSRAANIVANRNIVTISSTAADHIYESRGQSVYAASKAALNSLTKHMASEFVQFGIRVNGISPDSFPAKVKVDTILDSMMQLDKGTMTGNIVSMP